MNNSSHASKYLKKMRLNHGFLPLPDATLILDDESRHDVHKVVLASKSKFFDDLFVADDVWTYQISCVSEEAMKVILDCFYGIECSKILTPEIRQEIIDVSKEIDCKCPLVNAFEVPSNSKILSYEEIEELQFNKNE